MEDDDALMRRIIALMEKMALLHAKHDNAVYVFSPSTHDQIEAAMKGQEMTP